jgi:hypothetical protein
VISQTEDNSIFGDQAGGDREGEDCLVWLRLGVFALLLEQNGKDGLGKRERLKKRKSVDGMGWEDNTVIVEVWSMPLRSKLFEANKGGTCH